MKFHWVQIFFSQFENGKNTHNLWMITSCVIYSAVSITLMMGEPLKINFLSAIFHVNCDLLYCSLEIQIALTWLFDFGLLDHCTLALTRSSWLDNVSQNYIYILIPESLFLTFFIHYNCNVAYKVIDLLNCPRGFLFICAYTNKTAQERKALSCLEYAVK